MYAVYHTPSGLTGFGTIRFQYVNGKYVPALVFTTGMTLLFNKLCPVK